MVKGNFAQNRQKKHIRKSNRVIRRDWKKSPTSTKVAYDVARRVVSRALKRNVETKFRSLSNTIRVMKGTEIYLMNPLYYIPVDKTQADRLGDTLQHAKLHIKGTYYHRGVSLTQDELYSGAHFRIVVFKCNQQWRQSSESQFDLISGGSGPDTMTAGTLFRGPSFTGDNLHQLFTNLDQVKILVDKTVTSQRMATGFATSQGTSIEFHVPLGSVDFVSNTTGSFIKGDQIYVAIMASSLKTEGVIPTSSDFMGYFSSNVAITWKDA